MFSSTALIACWARPDSRLTRFSFKESTSEREMARNITLRTHIATITSRSVKPLVNALRSELVPAARRTGSISCLHIRGGPLPGACSPISANAFGITHTET
jgi:hypothetical protein